MKLSLLDMTQSILSSLSSDEVNSINDTTESLQVAEIIRQTYFNITSRAGLREHTGLFSLDDSGDPLKPVLMYAPDNVKRIEWIKYNDTSDTPSSYKYVTILPNDQFLEYVNSFNTDESWVDTMVFTVGGNTYDLSYKTDTQPTYCTMFNNYYVIFDSFDVSQDSTLQASKVQAYGETTPQWLTQDDFIPDLPDNQFPLLLSEAKALAFFELKQASHPKAEQENRRQWSSIQRDKARMERPTSFDALPNFGRIGNAGRSPRFVW